MQLQSGMDVAIHRPAAAAPVQILAWELSYAASADLKRKKKITFLKTSVKEKILKPKKNDSL